MKRFTNILVVLDGNRADDPALLRAAELARENGASLTVVLCLEEFGRDWPLDELRRAIVEGLAENLARLVDPVRDTGVRVETKLLFGRAFLEIILQVLRAGHDLVMKTAGGRGGLRAALFGSTDMHLLRKCPCPVWMFKPTPWRGEGGVLAAINPVPEDEERRQLCETILELASSLAALEGRPLHVVHAWSNPIEAMMALSPELPTPVTDVTAMAEASRAASQAAFERATSGLVASAAPARMHFLEGEPEDVIPTLVETAAIDVLVLATLGRSGIPGLFIGNTAEALLARVDCSILAIKPATFLTPVAA